jgi:hypothetical protein
MENFIYLFIANPILYIGYALSVVAAVGVLLFIAGFSGTIKHILYYSESAEHVEHARTRSLWGLYLCMSTLGVWQLIQMLLGEAPVTPTLILSALLLTPVWIPGIRSLFGGSGGGH